MTAETDDVSSLRPWRHALIVAEPHRYDFPAAEAQRAGFLPTRIPALVSNTSRCHPNPDRSNAIQNRIKFDNMLEAFQSAWLHIVQTDIPHVILEHDVVLATSRAEVQQWLDDFSTTRIQVDASHKSREIVVNRTTFVSVPRQDFDIAALGTCGMIGLACGHASWITPAGARILLATFPFTCNDEDRVYDQKVYYDSTHPYRHGAKVCATRCDPNRMRTTKCQDREAQAVVANRRCPTGANQSLWGPVTRLGRIPTAREMRDFNGRTQLSVSECGDRGEALRCLDWRELKVYQSRRKNGMRSFDARRYHGYGHFVQDRLATKSLFCRNEDESQCRKHLVPYG